MKIAVYTICLNEEQFVKRFMACVKNEADGVYVTDTGSTDDTVKLLQEEGAHTNVIKMVPWRFDIPRNISMDFMPDDIDVAVCIDLDEVLTPGWREAIEKAWKPDTNRLRYQYVWNTLPDGREGVTFWYDKIHLRHGFRWVKPVHEVMAWYGPNPEIQAYCSDFKLYHYPDPTKSRGSYLPLLELGCREEPEDDRNCHYLGREYMFYGIYQKGIDELKRHLSLPNAKWEAERAASMRYIGRCYTSQGNLAEAERWHLRACAEAPWEREPWVELGNFLYTYKKDHVGAYSAMKKALTISEKPMSYICDPSAWGSLPHDIAGVSAWVLGMKDEARTLIEAAVKLDPSDPRLQKNLQLVQG